jgi:transglutaminase-like putative cysteine protease
VHLALPQNRDNQIIEQDFEYTSSPTTIVTDKWGQKTARFLYMNLAAGQNRKVSLITRASIYEVNYFIYPENVGSINSIPKEIKSLYLKDDIKYQLEHPTIQKALKEAIGDEKNPYWISRKIYQYLMNKLYYEMAGGWNTAPTVLERGNGSCSEYSFVYIAMCRAAGVPARYVGAVTMRGDLNAMDDVFHRWVEVYLPNYGWIPVDPSGGDSDSPRHQARYFGHIANRYLITTQSGGGSETLDWTYNSHQYWSTLPKTYVVFEHYADWEAIQK